MTVEVKESDKPACAIDTMSLLTEGRRRPMPVVEETSLPTSTFPGFAHAGTIPHSPASSEAGFGVAAEGFDSGGGR
ncbi:hypothetical protein FHP29_14640 [Nocardioides albidus]|uniref:Uncharacterized protein n=1 Tax=Nocardioides albidus TaxID=1517589 RepID=A0A5C4VRN8_9ACTN|nr:hypothetical protein [Nocardioides albidus]TNM38480.1 hypothetical protein FHP29_14640 [Nocardioides albidus]